jgi:hypothetical protein
MKDQYFENDHTFKPEVHKMPKWAQTKVKPNSLKLQRNDEIKNKDFNERASIYLTK